jgi:hypothetical protein
LFSTLRCKCTSRVLWRGETVAEGTSTRRSRNAADGVPITFSIDLSASLIHTLGSGNVTLAEIDEHLTNLAKVWPRGAKLDVLLDLTSCTSLPEISQLRAVVSRIQIFGGRKRFGVCAIVAASGPLHGLLRVFELLAVQGFAAVRVFRSESAAIRWWCQRSSVIKQKAS